MGTAHSNFGTRKANDFRLIMNFKIYTIISTDDCQTECYFKRNGKQVSAQPHEPLASMVNILSYSNSHIHSPRSCYITPFTVKHFT